MISKTNFYNNTSTVYYILDNKIYSPKEFNEKIKRDGFTPKKTDSGMTWERTISIVRNPNNSPSHARVSIYPNHSVCPLVKKHAAAPFQESGFRLPVIINQRASKNDQKAKPIESKKTGIHWLQEGKIVSDKKSYFVPFQDKGHCCNPAAPRLEKEAIRDLWNDKHPLQAQNLYLNATSPQKLSENNQKAKPIESKKTGIYKLQEGKIVSDKKSDFVLFQGEGRCCNPAAPRLDREAIRNLLNDKYLQSSNEAYQMINNTLPFDLIRKKYKLLEKIKKEDYQSAICLIKKLDSLAPKNSISIKKSYENLLQQAYQKTKSAQEIAKETLRINPLALSNFSKAIELMVAAPGKPLVVYINHQEEQRRLAKQCLADAQRRGDCRNAL
ncbi:hypothetical protein [unidentified bacterial endosymbiont]|uniref:hypothetical protein n=1 Tax=unidentified bacterial endosymbiont TaxID=2355 RepID=UPI00209DCAA0|nr:hypothetical protein [unidentified bacterial endosymbiont]